MVVKEKLAQLKMGYCINLMQWKEKEYCITASEDRDGKVLMVDTETKDVYEIQGLQGGVMAMIPIPEKEGEFLAIQKFYPVFDSRMAEIVHVKLEAAEEKNIIPTVIKTVRVLPFVHRIALTGQPGERKVIAATLCEDKAAVDDWSLPGKVYEFKLDENWEITEENILLEGIHKNHGMYEYQKNGGSYLMISGEEGVWAIDEKSRTQRICTYPVSDLCLFDVDNDGIDEIICITPFHGNHVQILKYDDAQWHVADDQDIEFGHAVWSGKCGDKNIVIACGRAGDKNTRLYDIICKDRELEVQYIDIDEGVGSSNIVVTEKNGKVILYAANHEMDEIARYMIEL